MYIEDRVNGDDDKGEATGDSVVHKDDGDNGEVYDL